MTDYHPVTKERQRAAIRRNIWKYMSPDYIHIGLILRSMEYVRHHNMIPSNFFDKELEKYQQRERGRVVGMILHRGEHVQYLCGNDLRTGRIHEVSFKSYLIIDDEHGDRWDIPKDNKGLKIVGF